MQNKNEMDTFVYMMAAEKMVSLISLMEQTLEFMGEYKVKPDDEVKKALKPLLEQMKSWTDGK